MIEGGRLPRRGGMTLGTVMIKIITDMIRIADTAKIRLVAGKTVLRCGDITAGMTLDTGQGKVRPGQRKSSLAVIKN